MWCDMENERKPKNWKEQVSAIAVVQYIDDILTISKATNA